MSRGTQNLLVLFVGLLMVRLVVTKGYLSYVRPDLWWLLVVAGGVMVIVSAITLWTANEGSLRMKEQHPGHGNGAGWLLLVPLFALMAIDPAPLGAYAAGSRSARLPEIEATANFPPLPAAQGGAVPLGLSAFSGRALYGEPDELDGLTVRLTGFVTPDPELTDGFALTRFVVGCCAADAIPVQVIVHGSGSTLPGDTWLEVDGTWRRPPEPIPLDQRQLTRVHLDATSVRTIQEPEAPYESAF